MLIAVLKAPFPHVPRRVPDITASDPPDSKDNSWGVVSHGVFVCIQCGEPLYDPIPSMSAVVPVYVAADDTPDCGWCSWVPQKPWHSHQ